MQKLKLYISGAFMLATTFANQANATLISYTVNGVDLVYSTVSDVTWLKDANLLGTFFSQNIITVQDLVIFPFSESDFLNDGRTTFLGAIGFQRYLNIINYGGSSQWLLPFEGEFRGQAIGNPRNGRGPGYEFTELIYEELRTARDQAWNKDSKFINQKDSIYWTSASHSTNPNLAFTYVTLNGQVGTYGATDFAYAFFYTPGMITTRSVTTPVPEPETLGLLIAGLSLVTAYRRRNAK